MATAPARALLADLFRMSLYPVTIRSAVASDATGEGGPSGGSPSSMKTRQLPVWQIGHVKSAWTWRNDLAIVKNVVIVAVIIVVVDDDSPCDEETTNLSAREPCA